MYEAGLSAYDRADRADWAHLADYLDWNKMYLTSGLAEGTHYVLVNYQYW